MGMIANYQIIDDEELKLLLDIEEDEGCLQFVEDSQENEDLPILDIGEMWDVLHFILCGISASSPIEEYPLSEAVVGEYVLSEEYFISYTTKERVHKIVRALEGVDVDKVISHLDIESCKENNIYPDIWDSDRDIIISDLKEIMENMKAFYRMAYQKRKNILVSIY